MKLIRRGDEGPEVLLLQGMLRHLDYVLDVDGKFGPDTQTALEAFQASAGLPADGIVGQDTAAKLNLAVWNTPRAGDDDELDFTAG